MEKKQEGDEKIEGQDTGEDTQDTTETTQETSDSKTSDDGKKGYVTEESYRGLQKVVAKRDTTITELTGKIETLAAELEELKANSATTTSQVDTLNQTLEDANTALQEAQAERDKLSKQLERQKIVMEEFPELANFTDYIQPSDDPDEYRQSAKTFKESLEAYAEEKVKGVLKGSQTTVTDTREEASTAEEDSLWEIIYRTAGVRGKEAEYEEANKKLTALLESKSQ